MLCCALLYTSADGRGGCEWRFDKDASIGTRGRADERRIIAANRRGIWFG